MLYWLVGVVVFNEELSLLAYELREARINNGLFFRLEAVRIFMLLIAVLAFLLPLMIAVESTAESIAQNVRGIQVTFAGNV